MADGRVRITIHRAEHYARRHKAVNKFLFRNIDGTMTGEWMANHNEVASAVAAHMDYPAREARASYGELCHRCCDPPDAMAR